MGVAEPSFKQTTTFPQRHEPKLSWTLPPAWLRLLIISILVLGVFVRFVNLDQKVTWVDENYTSFRISGYTEPEIVRQVSEGKIFSVEDLQKYQQLNSSKTVVDTVKGLATEEPQVTPLYFVIARYWAHWFGDSITAMRSFPAITSLLVFPLVYWLCLELFESSLVGWIAIALIAISPFHLVYAQEARPYTLWGVTTLLSSVLLLRAMRLNTKRSWGIYAATVALGLYSHLFFALVAISHGIYVAAIDSKALATLRESGWRRAKALKAYLLATAAGFLAFLPWIVIVIAYLPQIIRATPEQNQSPRQPLFSFAKTWLGNLSRDFFDLGLVTESLLNSPLPVVATVLVIMLAVPFLVGYSLYFLYRQTPPRVWLFVLCLIGVTALALALPDLILGGRRSFLTRYFVPCHLGIQLAVAYLFSSKISYAFSARQQKLWQLALVAVLSLGVISATAYTQADTWWQKKTNAFNPELAPLLNQAASPLVIKEMPRNFPPHSFFNLVSLSYGLEPQAPVKFLPIFEGSVPKIPQNFSDVYIIEPSDILLARLRRTQNIKIQKVDKVQQAMVIKLIQG